MSDDSIDETILRLTRQRSPDKTVCPSEVARYLAPQDWRPLMEPVRDRARVLAREGRIDVTQSSVAIDPFLDWRGPIRLRWRDQED